MNCGPNLEIHGSEFRFGGPNDHSSTHIPFKTLTDTGVEVIVKEKRLEYREHQTGREGERVGLEEGRMTPG